MYGVAYGWCTGDTYLIRDEMNRVVRTRNTKHVKNAKMAEEMATKQESKTTKLIEN